jgi:hypothetical protein
VTDETEAELEHLMRLIADSVDPVPAAAVRAAKESFVWRTIDAELAALAYDSAVDRDTATLVRSATQTRDEPRVLTFTTPRFTVEIEVVRARRETELFGQVVPAGPSSVQIRHPGGVVELSVDDLGRFGPGRLPVGPVSLRFAGPDEAPFITQWVPI